MGNFLNVIVGDLDNVKEEFFYSRSEQIEKRFYSYLKYFDLFGFSQIKKCELSETNNLNENYFYIFNDICNYKFAENGLCLKDEILDILKKQNNLFIVYINEQEYIKKSDFECVLKGIKKDKINEERFILINNNARLDEYKTQFNSKINVWSTKYLPYFSVSKIFENKDIDFEINKKFLFMSHNKRCKPIRISLLCYMKQNNLLNDLDWSLMCNGNIDTVYNNVKEFYDLDYIKDEVNYFNNLGIVKSFYEKNFSWDGGGPDPIHVETFTNSYINITTESNFSDEEIHITEKSFKPFFFYQIPIIIASRYHINKMKENFGFDFFEDLVDISYDMESDNKKRFFMIMEIINDLSKKKDYIKSFYIQNKERFLKNKDLSLEIIKKNEDYKFLKNLI